MTWSVYHATRPASPSSPVSCRAKLSRLWCPGPTVPPDRTVRPPHPQRHGPGSSYLRGYLGQAATGAADTGRRGWPGLGCDWGLLLRVGDLGHEVLGRRHSLAPHRPSDDLGGVGAVLVLLRDMGDLVEQAVGQRGRVQAEGQE